MNKKMITTIIEDKLGDGQVDDFGRYYVIDKDPTTITIDNTTIYLQGDKVYINVDLDLTIRDYKNDKQIGFSDTSVSNIQYFYIW